MVQNEGVIFGDFAEEVGVSTPLNDLKWCKLFN
jgi:hypothetical protein